MPGQRWSEKEIAELRKLAPAGIGSAEIARRLTKRFKRNFTSVSAAIKAQRLALPIKAPSASATPPPVRTRKDIDREGELAVLRDRISLATKERKLLKRRVGELQEIRKIINATCQPMRPAAMRFKPRKRQGDSYSAVPLVGDWHTGEVIDPKATAGWGAYNLAVQEQRVRAYGAKVLEWLETQRSGLNIPRLRVPVLGDMVSGNIHYELEVTNEVPVPEAACLAGKMLAELIAGWAPHAEQVEVDVIGEANHDRLTLKHQHKQGSMNSWNRVVYWVAAAFLRDHPNVKVAFHVDSPAELDFDGLGVLAMHGHQVRAWMGIPSYGMQRMLGRLALGYMVHGKAFKTIICGHWHQPFELPGWIVNGCLSGTSEYDRDAGRFAPPSQTSFLWHGKKHGAFNLTRWDLTEA